MHPPGRKSSVTRRTTSARPPTTNSPGPLARSIGGPGRSGRTPTTTRRGESDDDEAATVHPLSPHRIEVQGWGGRDVRHVRPRTADARWRHGGLPEGKA